MATLVETGLPEMLRELGTELHDLDLSESADGTISRDYAARAIFTAAREIARRLRRQRVPDNVFAPYTFTLSADPNDSERYLLPRRAKKIFWLKDSSGYYESHDAGELGRTGFLYEGNAIRLRNATVNGSLQASIVLDPPTPSYGQAAASTGASSVVLATSPTIGRTALEPSYYVGAWIAMESGDAAGEIRQVTAYNESTRACTVSAFSSAPAENDYYTILLGLPQQIERAVLLRAAMIIMRTDKSLDVDRDRIAASFNEAWGDGVNDLKHAISGHIHTIRRVWNSGFEQDNDI